MGIYEYENLWETMGYEWKTLTGDGLALRRWQMGARPIVGCRRTARTTAVDALLSQRAIPAQIACTECTQCSRVAGELGGRRATDFNLLTNYALNVGTSSLREALQQLESSRACR